MSSSTVLPVCVLSRPRPWPRSVTCSPSWRRPSRTSRRFRKRWVLANTKMKVTQTPDEFLLSKLICVCLPLVKHKHIFEIAQNIWIMTEPTLMKHSESSQQWVVCLRFSSSLMVSSVLVKHLINHWMDWIKHTSTADDLLVSSVQTSSWSEQTGRFTDVELK